MGERIAHSGYHQLLNSSKDQKLYYANNEANCEKDASETDGLGKRAWKAIFLFKLTESIGIHVNNIGQRWAKTLEKTVPHLYIKKKVAPQSISKP